MMFEPKFARQINITEKSHDDEVKAFDIVYLPGFTLDDDNYDQNKLLYWNIINTEDKSMSVFLYFTFPILIFFPDYRKELLYKQIRLPPGTFSS